MAILETLITFKPYSKNPNRNSYFIYQLQPLVRLSFNEPKATFDTNVGGSINVFEAIDIWFEASHDERPEENRGDHGNGLFGSRSIGTAF